MATYKIRGTSHNVIYLYKTSSGETKQQWEAYNSELEAVQRKAYIDFLQSNKRTEDIFQAAMEYKRNRAIEKNAQKIAQENPNINSLPVPQSSEENLCRTFREFMERFLPIHAKKRNFSPRTYDSYVTNLNTHIYPYFGDWLMSAITAQAIDDFIAYLAQKPCKGSKSYGKKPSEIPHLSSPTVKKCYNILTVGFPTAKNWGYIKEIPRTTAPSEKTKKRKAWTPQTVSSVLSDMVDDPILHLAVHLTFVCSLRASEVVGLKASTIDFRDRSMWISQIIERVSDEAIHQVPQEKIIQIFPKQVSTSKSNLILKLPKTEDSYRKQYLTTPLLQEIKQRLETIRANKEFFGEEYCDYDLLLCQPNGNPIDPRAISKAFKDWQSKKQIGDQIEFHGLRKSGQMHKVRLSKNNYQLVAESSGQSPEVLMSNYNEALDSEKRALSLLVETSFYRQAEVRQAPPDSLESLLEDVKKNPELSKKLLQLLLSDALNSATAS